MSLFDQIGHTLDPNRIANEARDKVNQVINDLQNEGHQISDQLQNELTDRLHNVLHQVEDEFNKDIEKLKDAAEQVANLASSFTPEAFNKAITKVLEVASECPVYPASVSLVLPFVEIEFADIEDKLDHLHTYSASGVHGREQIINFVKQLLPTNIIFEPEVTLVVSVGGKLNFSSDYVEEALNYILDKAGL